MELTKDNIVKSLMKYNLPHKEKIEQCLFSNIELPIILPGYFDYSDYGDLHRYVIHNYNPLDFLDYKPGRLIYEAFVIILKYEYQENSLIDLMTISRCWTDIDLFETYFKILRDNIS